MRVNVVGKTVLELEVLTNGINWIELENMEIFSPSGEAIDEKNEENAIQEDRERTKSELDHNQLAISAMNDGSENSAVVNLHISLRSSPTRFDIL